MKYAAFDPLPVRGIEIRIHAESARVSPVNDKHILGHSDLVFRTEASEGNQRWSECRSQRLGGKKFRGLRKQDWGSAGLYVMLSLDTVANRMLPEQGWQKANPGK